MSDNISDTLDLLKRAKRMGITICMHNDKELNIKFRKRDGIAQSFIEELRVNKNALLEYFKSCRQVTANLSPETKEAPEAGTHVQYDVPLAYHWWIDENKDRDVKRKIYLLLSYKITGNFDVVSFRKSVSYLVGRHESLRSTFHTKSGQYKMEILETDSPLLEPDFMDFSNERCPNEAKILNLSRFSDHEFQLQTGPLFLIRLIKISDNKTAGF